MAKSHNNYRERVDDKMVAKKKGSGRGGSFLLGAALGAAAGTVAGVLTAPKSGKQTRADIARGSKKVVRKATAEGKKLAKKAGVELKKVTGGKSKKKTTAKTRK